MLNHELRRFVILSRSEGSRQSNEARFFAVAQNDRFYDFAQALPGRVESSTLEPCPIDRWLAEQPGDFAAAFLPPGYSNYEAMFGSLYHGKHLPAFNHPQHLPDAFKAFAQRGADFPSADAIEALRNMHFRYLLIDRRFYDQPGQIGWQAIETTLRNTPRVSIVADVTPYVVVAFTNE